MLTLCYIGTDKELHNNKETEKELHIHEETEMGLTWKIWGQKRN